jgi:hypothetical protein
MRHLFLCEGAARSGTTARPLSQASSGVCFPGNDLRRFNSTSTDGADCCAACQAEPKCAGWTHNADSSGAVECYIKSALKEGTHGAKCISGGGA